MRHIRFLVAPAFLAAMGGLAAAAPGVSEVASPQLASHKAIYDLSLVEGAGTKTPASASGRIAYDFSSACEGYAQTLRQVVDMQPQEGERQVTETRTSTYEDAKGADFRFTIATPGGKGVEVDGHAERNAAGALAIALNRPQSAKLSAGQDVLFPTQHIEKLIQAAEAGERLMLARVYDGSEDGQKIFAVTAVIGKAATQPDPDAGAQIPALSGLRRWPVALAYFPDAQRDGTPDYVLSFNIYENGVSSGLKLDYGDFVLTGELKGIEFPQPAKCRR